MSRLFVALWPPDDVVAALSELHRKDQVGARFVPPENWHVTLRFLGNADPNDVAAALDTVAPEPTTIRLGPGVDLGAKNRTVFVPASGADRLAAAVVSATRTLGDQPIRTRYLGHVTLARLKRGANVPRVVGEHIDAAWSPSGFALVESTLRPEGARYDTLQTWPIPQPDDERRATEPQTAR